MKRIILCFFVSVCAGKKVFLDGAKGYNGAQGAAQAYMDQQARKAQVRLKLQGALAARMAEKLMNQPEGQGAVASSSEKKKK